MTHPLPSAKELVQTLEQVHQPRTLVQAAAMTANGESTAANFAALLNASLPVSKLLVSATHARTGNMVWQPTVPPTATTTVLSLPGVKTTVTARPQELANPSHVPIACGVPSVTRSAMTSRTNDVHQGVPT